MKDNYIEKKKYFMGFIMSDEESIEVLEMYYEYDYDDDALFIYGIDESEYKESITVDETFVLDINDFNEPESFEILNISDMLEVDYELLLDPVSVSGTIEVEQELIMVNLIFVFEENGREFEKSQIFQMTNYFNLETYKAKMNIHFI